MIEHSTSAMQISTLLEQYVTLYGRGVISIINYPEIPREKFVTYLDSMRITLKRYGKAPVYLWLHEPDLRRYRLILLTNAYFVKESNEIVPVLMRLWQNQSDIPFQVQSWYIVDPDNLNAVKNDLANLGWHSRPETAGWHQRMFGTSHI